MGRADAAGRTDGRSSEDPRSRSDDPRWRSEDPRWRSEDMVVLAGACKSFKGHTVVDSLDLSIAPGTIAGLIGPSGCGKTTSIRLMTGGYRPTAGTARVLGRDPTRLGRVQRARLGYLPQLPALYPHLTLWQNLRFLSALNGVGWRGRKRLASMLELVDLAEAKGTRVVDASGGMQRRLALAATLSHDPVLLFLDEPTAGIDPILRARFWDHFRALRDEGRTLVVTTQYVGEAAWCDTVSVISEGQLVATDTPDGLRRRAFGGEPLRLQLERPPTPQQQWDLGQLPSITAVELERADRRVLHLTADDAGAAVPRILEWCAEQELAVEACEERSADFDEVFLRLVEGHRAASEAGGHARDVRAS